MSDFSDIDNLLDSMGKRHPRTLLCELEPDFDSAVAAKVEEGLCALAEQWKHSSLLFPAIRVAVLAESQSGRTLEGLMRSLGSDIAPTPTPAMRAASIAMRLLALPIDIDGGPILSGMNAREVEHALLAWIVIEYSTGVGSMTLARAKQVWQKAELAPELWQDRIRRLAKEYEDEKYST